MAGRVTYHGGLVTDGLVLHLDAARKPSYPGSGDVWYDLTSNQYTGSLVNGTGYDKDEANGTFIFDGVDDYVNLPTVDIPTTSFTCETVFKYDQTANGNTLFNLNYSYPNSGYLIRQNSLGAIIVYTDDGNETAITSNTGISPNTVYHLTVIQNARNCSIYLNGVLDRSSTLDNPVLDSNKGTYLGMRGEPSIGARLNGNMYIAKIYNRALTAQEVQRNYQALKSRFGL